jgi:hypothetical protein
MFSYCLLDIPGACACVQETLNDQDEMDGIEGFWMYKLVETVY